MKRSIDDTLIDANIKRLDAEKDSTEQSSTTKSLLRQINKLGFITTHHQDGFAKIGNVPNDVREYISATKHIAQEMGLNETPDKVDEETTRQIEAKRQRVYRRGFHRGPILHQRASVTGYVRRELAQKLHFHLNMTDKVCIVQSEEGIPTKYSLDTVPSFNQQPHPQYLSKNMFTPISTSLSVRFDGPIDPLVTMMNDPKIGADLLQKQYVLVQCFDPQHGRKAVSETGLLQDIVTVLKL